MGIYCSILTMFFFSPYTNILSTLDLSFKMILDSSQEFTLQTNVLAHVDTDRSRWNCFWQLIKKVILACALDIQVGQGHITLI